MTEKTDAELTEIKAGIYNKKAVVLGLSQIRVSCGLLEDILPDRLGEAKIPKFIKCIHSINGCLERRGYSTVYIHRDVEYIETIAFENADIHMIVIHGLKAVIALIRMLEKQCEEVSTDRICIDSTIDAETVVRLCDLLASKQMGGIKIEAADNKGRSENVFFEDSEKAFLSSIIDTALGDKGVMNFEIVRGYDGYGRLFLNRYKDIVQLSAMFNRHIHDMNRFNDGIINVYRILPLLTDLICRTEEQRQSGAIRQILSSGMKGGVHVRKERFVKLALMMIQNKDVMREIMEMKDHRETAEAFTKQLLRMT